MKKAVPCILITAFLFATMEIVLKIGGRDFDALQLTFLRFFIGGVVMLPIGIREYRTQYTCKGKHISTNDVLWLVLLGIVCVPISMVLFQFGVENCNAATAAATMCTNPLFTLVITRVFTKEKMSKSKAISVFIGLVACIFLIRPWNIQDGNSSKGFICMIGAAITCSIFSVMTTKTVARVGTFTQTSVCFIVGSLILLAIMLMLGSPVLTNIMEHPLTVAYTGIAVTGIGYISYFTAIRYSDAITASMIFFIKPVISPFLAIAILHETIMWNTTLGIALLVVAAIVMMTEEKNKYKKQI